MIALRIIAPLVIIPKPKLKAKSVHAGPCSVRTEVAFMDSGYFSVGLPRKNSPLVSFCCFYYQALVAGFAVIKGIARPSPFLAGVAAVVFLRCNYLIHKNTIHLISFLSKVHTAKHACTPGTSRLLAANCVNIEPASTGTQSTLALWRKP
jgi:hypothetical protein